MAKKKSKKSPLNKFVIVIAVLLLALAILTGIGSKNGMDTADTKFIDENIPELSEYEQYINIILSLIKNSGSGSSPAAETDTVTIGSFNIQVFGQKKASDDKVMTTLAEIIRNFDIIAIQEIRDSSGTAAPLLLQYVNSDGSDYGIFTGERLGRTSSKEQYAYLYNKNTIRPAGEPVTYPDSESYLFHREPYIMPFETTGGDFTATCAVIHTDPDEAREEIPALINVMDYMTGVLPGDDTLILMGDFNADCSYFNEDSYITLKSEEYQWLIGNSEDTTTGNSVCTYDRIVLNGGEEYYTGDSGVFRFDSTYGLSQDESLKVSDHYPVYARFKTSENGIIPTVNRTPSATAATTPMCSGDTCMQGSSVIITGINPVSEEVTIRNTGDEDKQVSGWRLSDSGYENTYIFPQYTISAKTTVTITPDINSTEENILIWHNGDEIWDDTGDCAFLYDEEGNQASEFCISI